MCRMGELLCRNPKRFDNLTDLLMEEVRLKRTRLENENISFLAVKLKSTKTCRKLEKGLEIEIFEIKGPLCPVKAWKRYIQMAGDSEPELPAFRQEGGLAYSHGMFNRDLRTLFKGRVNYGAVSAHSFRQDHHWVVCPDCKCRFNKRAVRGENGSDPWATITRVVMQDRNSHTSGRMRLYR